MVLCPLAVVRKKISARTAPRVSEVNDVGHVWFVFGALHVQITMEATGVFRILHTIVDDVVSKNDESVGRYSVNFLFFNHCTNSVVPVPRKSSWLVAMIAEA